VEPPRHDQLPPHPYRLDDGGALMIAIVAIVAVQLALALVLFGTAALDRRIGQARARGVLVVASGGVRSPGTRLPGPS